jgi:hypothetical protein
LVRTGTSTNSIGSDNSTDINIPVHGTLHSLLDRYIYIPTKGCVVSVLLACRECSIDITVRYSSWDSVPVLVLLYCLHIVQIDWAPTVHLKIKVYFNLVWPEFCCVVQIWKLLDLHASKQYCFCGWNHFSWSLDNCIMTKLVIKSHKKT